MFLYASANAACAMSPCSPLSSSRAACRCLSPGSPSRKTVLYPGALPHVSLTAPRSSELPGALWTRIRPPEKDGGQGGGRRLGREGRRGKF